MAINNNALASSQATVLSEDGNTLYATIQMRHGKESDMDKSKFVPAEIGVCTDTKKAVVAFAPNETKEIAFKDELSEIVEESLADKLDKNQGAGNAGKMLVVGDDGNVQVGDEPVKVDPTLTKSGQAGDALEAGHRIDRKAPAIVQDAFGYGGVITDSAEASFQGLKVYGASRQFTTTGANLLPNDVSHSTSDGINVTLTEDGAIHLSGTTKTTNTDLYFVGNADVYKEFPAGTYTMINNSISDNDDISFYFVIKDRSGGLTNINNIVGVNTAKTFDVIEGDTVRIFLRIRKAGISLDDYFYPMLNAGSTALPFEPYTGGQPAPNPDYPQDIEVPGSDGTVGIDLYGKNLLNTYRAEIGAFSRLTGKPVSDSEIYRFAEGVLVEPSETLYFSKGLVSYFYNKEGEYIAYDDILKLTITVPENAYVVKFRIFSSDFSTFNSSDYMVSKTPITVLEPYKPKQTFTLQTPNGLPGIPVTSGGNYTDSEGQRWICDEIDLERGKYVQRICKIVFDGSSDEVWKLNQVNSYGIANFNIYKPLSGTAIISDRFIRQSSLITNTTTEGIMASGATTIHIRIKQERASDVDSFRSWLNENSVTVLYVLPTPIETDLSDEEIAAYKALRTNYPTTTVMTDTDPQVTLDMQYAVDTKTYIDNKIAEYVQSAISNSLLSTNTAQALSAPMGAELSNRIETLEQKLAEEE